MSTQEELAAVVSGFIDGKVDQERTRADQAVTALADANGRLSSALASLEQAQADDVLDKGTIASLTAALTALQRSPHYLDGWGEPTFLDEFVGDRLDPAKWRVYDGMQLSYDMATAMASNVQVRDGKLHLLAKRELVNGRPWTSSYITTGALASDRSKPDLFSQKYGRFEARIKVPSSPLDSAGIWGAFWGRSRGTSGELDIMETWGSPQNGPGTKVQTYRPGSGQWTFHQDTNHAAGTKKKSGWLTPAGSQVQLSDDFHVYGLEWTPAGFKVLLDGKVVQYGDNPNAALGFPADVFNDLYHLRLQVQVGQASYWGVPDANTKDADMVVDWVRAYAFKE